jgi:uncharacterized membrane protein
MLARIRTEPALVSGLIAAALALGISFGLPVSAEQLGFIMAAVTAVLAVLVRSQVTPVADPPTPPPAG